MTLGLDILNEKPLYYFFIIIKISINIFLILLVCFLIYYLIHIGNQYIENSNMVKINKKYLYYFVLLIILFICLFTLYQFRIVLWKLLAPVVWSIIFAYLLNPMVRFIERRGFQRIWSVIIVYTSIFALISIFSITITPKITMEVSNLIELLPKYTYEVSDYLNKIYLKIEQLDSFSPQLSAVKESITDNLLNIEHYILNSIKTITSSIFKLFTHIVGLVLIPIYTFYFLKDIDYFKKKLIFIVPKSYRNELTDIFKDINILLTKFVQGQLIVAACVGILSTIALAIIKVDFAFLIGMIAGISNVIPYFGPIIGAIPGVLFALLDEPSKALWVIIAFTAIQQIESGILSPKIVGESVGIHPIMVILTLLIGNEYFGVIGMIFAVPVAASLKIITKHIIDLIVKA